LEWPERFCRYLLVIRLLRRVRLGFRGVFCCVSNAVR